jgi:hypothetical protein
MDDVFLPFTLSLSNCLEKRKRKVIPKDNKQEKNKRKRKRSAKLVKLVQRNPFLAKNTFPRTQHFCNLQSKSKSHQALTGHKS